MRVIRNTVEGGISLCVWVEREGVDTVGERKLEGVLGYGKNV